MTSPPQVFAALGAQFESLVLDGLRGPSPRESEAHAQSMHECGVAWAQELVDHGLGDPTHEDLRALVEPLSRALAQRPEDWTRALNLIHLFADRPRGRNKPQQPDTLANATLFTLVAAADEEARIAFFRSIDEWFALRAVSSCLPDLHLNEAEVIAVLTRIDEATRSDSARGSLIDGIARWAIANVAAACALVMQWTRSQPETRDLRWDIVFQLALAGSRGASGAQWRATLLDALHCRGDTDAATLAVFAACFAWPDSVAVADRHVALLDEVCRSPAWLVDHGLACMASERPANARDALRTATALLELVAGQGSTDEIAWNRADTVAAIVLRALPHAGAEGPGLALSLLPALLPTPPERGSGWLDGALTELHQVASAAVMAFLDGWMGHHVDAFERNPKGFRELLPLLYDSMGSDGVAAWIVHELVHPRGDRRRAAIRLLTDEQLRSFPAAAVTELDDAQAEALLHVLAISVPIALRLPLTLQIGTSREALAAPFGELLMELAEDHPEPMRDALGAQGRADGVGAELRERVLARIASADRSFERLSTIVESIATRPTAATWDRIFDERLQRDWERARGQFPLLSMVTTVPIIRGGAMVAGASTHGARTEMKEVTSDFIHLPLGESVDPVAAALRRHLHDQRAAKLLADRTGEHT